MCALLIFFRNICSKECLGIPFEQGYGFHTPLEIMTEKLLDLFLFRDYPWVGDSSRASVSVQYFSIL